MYYQFTQDFEHKLLHLLAVLELPKEIKLEERFQEIEKTLQWAFATELLHRLQLIQDVHTTEGSDHQESHPQLLLHLYCLLGCTDSIEYIARYLELTIVEVQELIRELHNTFSIDSLAVRIRHYYEANKRMAEAPTLQLQHERLGMAISLVPKDVNEDRKRRLRKKYGRLVETL